MMILPVVVVERMMMTTMPKNRVVDSSCFQFLSLIHCLSFGGVMMMVQEMPISAKEAVFSDSAGIPLG
jgi:hypothetical protein